VLQCSCVGEQAFMAGLQCLANYLYSLLLHFLVLDVCGTRFCATTA
jgi:hypothetical protein